MKQQSKNIGLGCLQRNGQFSEQRSSVHSSQLNPELNPSYSIAVYLANKPNMPEYVECDGIQVLAPGDITAIGLACGNGWRKVFNVYSKLLYALPLNDFSFKTLAPTWQAYRDEFLLQQGSATALLFSAPLLQADNHCIHIISGKTHAKDLINRGKLNV